MFTGFLWFCSKFRTSRAKSTGNRLHKSVILLYLTRWAMFENCLNTQVSVVQKKVNSCNYGRATTKDKMVYSRTWGTHECCLTRTVNHMAGFTRQGFCLDIEISSSHCSLQSRTSDFPLCANNQQFFVFWRICPFQIQTVNNRLYCGSRKSRFALQSDHAMCAPSLFLRFIYMHIYIYNVTLTKYTMQNSETNRRTTHQNKRN